MSIIHDLKTWPEYYKDIASGVKTFEVRRNDRNFMVGDMLLREFAPCIKCGGGGKRATWSSLDKKCCESPHGTYTGNVATAAVTYVLDRGPFPLPGYCVMAIKATEEHVT